MFQANQTLTAGHPYSSKWYTWPLELRPIYYWEGEVNDKGMQGNIYLLGNPVIWWGIPISLLAGFGWLSWKRHCLSRRAKGALGFLALAFFINLAPFMAVSRVMFLYHYFYSFIFSLAAAVLLWQDIASHAHDRNAVRRWVVIVALIALISYLYFAPLTFGIPISPNDLQQHMWLKTWR
jgi:dolichyl-phosphate-mannose--protein O-mannosyl transferase